MLPKAYRNIVLEASHSAVYAGHLGHDNTLAKIKRLYYWPGMATAVRRMCRSCPTCQKATRWKRSRKVPLCPLPIIDKPFRRIGMDLIGPLPRTKTGYRYVLVIVDYGTRFPEAILLKKTDTDTIIVALIPFFGRVGFPEEVLPDRGTNFTSKLMQDFQKMVGIKAIRTSSYHPQTDGMVERFNACIKASIEKLAPKFDLQWEKALPWVLMAHRGAVHRSTGYTPYELMYGWPVRGVLDVMKEKWEEKEGEPQSVLTYMVAVQNRLKVVWERAKEREKKKKDKMKMYYDRGARERTYEFGDMVLAMLPGGRNKMSLEWRGPYPVVRKLSGTTYEVRKERDTCVLHALMLERWKEPTAACLQASAEPLSLQMEYYDKGEVSDEPVLEETLTSEQKEEVKDLLAEFKDIMGPTPGLTSMMTIDIDTGDAQPIFMAFYRLAKG